MRIAIGCDHAGIEQKPAIAEYLSAKGFEVVDLGCYSAERVDYPDYAVKVSECVASGDADFGILICGTGIGMSIAANKVAGIRAANVTRADMAPLARQHNDANVLTLSARFVALEENEAIIDAFLAAEFEGGRHEGRVAKINALD
ncbi:MAG: ribose 5-phosphate isomerase B [Coriobacteriales bacterium]|nr:ribose 5-phosphate isomerase B [Coriobacteriales bacterium]